MPKLNSAGPVTSEKLLRFFDICPSLRDVTASDVFIYAQQSERERERETESNPDQTVTRRQE